MDDRVLLDFAVLLIASLLGARLAQLLHLPAVTGYLLAGLVLGPSVLGVFSPDESSLLAPINDLALGTIAFSIGSEFQWKKLAKLGASVTWITLAQGLGTFLMVDLVLTFVLHQPQQIALLLGAIATATAPAATLLVIREYKARGPLTDMLLAVVALDDALGIIVFGIISAACKAMLGGASGWQSMLLAPLWEIACSLAIGAILGYLLGIFSRRLRSADQLTCLTIGSVLLVAGIAPHFELSLLLTAMMMGTVVVNLLTEHQRVFRSISGLEAPLYAIFFTLAGAGLDFRVLLSTGAIGVGYILARALGKVLGAAAGATLTHASPAIRRYLGIALLPQAGVAIGLTMLAAREFPELGNLLTTLVLAGVFVYELIGPPCAKLAVVGAGEIGQDAEISA